MMILLAVKFHPKLFREMRYQRSKNTSISISVTVCAAKIEQPSRQIIFRCCEYIKRTAGYRR
jgi:hypothetical protein